MTNLLFAKKYLPYRVAIGFILGIIAGLMFNDFSIWIKPAGDLFMNLIKMLIVPVIFFSLTSGIAAIGDVQKLKRIGTKVVLVYVVMTVVACLLGILVVIFSILVLTLTSAACLLMTLKILMLYRFRHFCLIWFQQISSVPWPARTLCR